MPILVLKHKRAKAHSRSKIKKFGVLARPVVARFCSIKGVRLTENAVDYEPNAYHPAAIAPVLSVEIETIDFPLRVKKLTRRRTVQLKAELAKLLKQCGLPVPKGAWLWMKYVSRKGHHV